MLALDQQKNLIFGLNNVILGLLICNISSALNRIPLKMVYIYVKSWVDVWTSDNRQAPENLFCLQILEGFYMSRAMRKCILFNMPTTKAQISLHIRAVWSVPLLFAV